MQQANCLHNADNATDCKAQRHKQLCISKLGTRIVVVPTFTTQKLDGCPRETA